MNLFRYGLSQLKVTSNATLTQVFIAKTRKPAGLVVSVTMLADSWWAKLHGQGLLLLSLKERLVECFRHCSGQLI